MIEEPDFHGAKVALFVGNEILVYRRDDKPDIPFPDMLDLPGGGRESCESGVQCVARETQEEFGINIAIEKFEYIEAYPNWRNEGLAALFYVCYLPSTVMHDIVFGDEGQNWQTMPVKDFLMRPDAVPHLQERLTQYVNRQHPTISR